MNFDWQSDESPGSANMADFDNNTNGTQATANVNSQKSGARSILAGIVKRSVLLPLIAVASFATTADASVIFSGSSGNRAASVDFSLSGTTLTITLTNTGNADVVDPGGVLTAVFFDLASGADPLLTKISAISGGTTYAGGGVVSAAGTVVGGEWAYLNGLNQYGANSGISSAGFGIFGAGDVFPGGNLFGPASPSGVQYGITSAGDDVATGNAGISSEPLTKNSVLFTLNNFSGSLSDISNVTFQYDASLTAISVASAREGGTVPEPGTVALLGLGLAGMAFIRRRNQ
jgi:hypothetical protein